MFDLEPPFAASEQWESLGPPGTVWQEVLDDASGELYYWNKTTGETTWECPWEEEPFIFFEEVEGSEGRRSVAASRQGRTSRTASTQSGGKEGNEQRAQTKTAEDQKDPGEQIPSGGKSTSQGNAEEGTKSQSKAEDADKDSEGPTTPPPETPPPDQEQAESKQSSVHQPPTSSPLPPSEPQKPRVLPSKLFRLHSPQPEKSPRPLDEKPPPPPPRPVPSIETIGKLLDSPMGSGRSTTGSMSTLLALKQHTKRMQRR